jgi:hypothetical protein
MFPLALVLLPACTTATLQIGLVADLCSATAFLTHRYSSASCINIMRCGEPELWNCMGAILYQPHPAPIAVCVTAGTAHDKESLNYIQVTSRYNPVNIGCSRCACYPPPAQPLLIISLLGSCATSEHEHVSQATGARVPVNFHRLCVNFSVRLLGECLDGACVTVHRCHRHK